MNTTALPYAAHWSLGLSEGIVQDIDDINQCISIIFTTEVGSDPTRPDFGGGWHPYIDYPTDELMVQLVSAYTIALRRWEPRIVVDAIEPSANAEHVTCRVKYHIKPEVAGQFTNKYETEAIYGRAAKIN